MGFREINKRCGLIAKLKRLRKLGQGEWAFTSIHQSHFEKLRSDNISLKNKDAAIASPLSFSNRAAEHLTTLFKNQFSA
jgi:hypothetical protein